MDYIDGSELWRQSPTMKKQNSLKKLFQIDGLFLNVRLLEEVPMFQQKESVNVNSDHSPEVTRLKPRNSSQIHISSSTIDDKQEQMDENI